MFIYYLYIILYFYRFISLLFLKLPRQYFLLFQDLLKLPPTNPGPIKFRMHLLIFP